MSDDAFSYFSEAQQVIPSVTVLKPLLWLQRGKTLAGLLFEYVWQKSKCL